MAFAESSSALCFFSLSPAASLLAPRLEGEEVDPGAVEAALAVPGEVEGGPLPCCLAVTALGDVEDLQAQQVQQVGSLVN